MTCPSCLKVERGTHPDVFLVSPQGEFITVDQVRSLISALSFAPFEGRMKVAIVDGAERMHWSASNALLKTLEEPPSRTLLILLTSSPEALPQTVLSRCQKVRFSPLEREAVTTWLEERQGWPQGRAALAASLSEGSLGRAMEMDEGFLEMRGTLIAQVLFSSQTGRTGLTGLFDAAKECGKQDLRGSLEIIEGLLADLLKMIVGREGKIMNKDVTGDLRGAVRWYAVPDILRVYDSVIQIREAMVRNINPELAMDMLLLDVRSRRER